MSWTRKLLRVNLSNATVTEEALNMQWANDYLGQRGLATRYASTGGRYSIICKSPLTNAIACSNSGGFFGAELKFAGWDMVIFEGRANSPMYLSIENEKATLLPADDLWGKSVWDADKALRTKHQDPQARIACVGRSAEQGCLYAAVVNDLHRAAGRSGVGTVMASKNLKAVVVRGTLGIGNVDNPEAFMSTTKAGK